MEQGRCTAIVLAAGQGKRMQNKTCKVRFVGQITDCKADDPADKLYDGLKKLICAVIDDYGYLITK